MLRFASLSGLNRSAELLPFHQVLICDMHILPQLRQFWIIFWGKLGDEGLYQISIGPMRLRLLELQESNDEAQKIRTVGLKNGYKEIDGILYHQGLPFVSEAIRIELISQHPNNPLKEHFGIDKTKDLVGRKYYWPCLRKDIEAYVKCCEVCLSSKKVRHKPYGDLQSLSVSTYWWKDLLIDFVTRLPISTN